MASPRDRRRRMIGVSLGAKTMAEAREVLPRLAAVADIAEIRLDFFEEPCDLPRLLRDRPLPVIVTNRPPREGGRCDRPDAERLAVLRQAAELGAEYVDVEWDVATPAALAPIKAAGARVLVSRHSFREMPSEFVDWVDLTIERGADVVKIVGMARRVQDSLAVFDALSRSPLPTIAIAMGEAGLISRVLALRHDNCFLTYATLGQGERVAPGQLPIATMHEVYQAEKIGAATAVFGVLGAETAPDGLLAWLNRATREADLDAVWVPFVAPEGGGDGAAEVVRAYRRPGVAGYLVAGSAELAVRPALDDITSPGPDGRINAIRREGERLIGIWSPTLPEAFTLVTGRQATPPAAPASR